MNLELFKKCVGKSVTLELSCLNFRNGKTTDFEYSGVIFAPCENAASDMIISVSMTPTK